MIIKKTPIFDYNLFLLLFLLFFCSCTKHNNNIAFKIQQNSNITFISESNSKLEAIVLKPINIHGIFTDIAVLDSLLICGNLRSEKLINIYSLNNNKLINKIINRGNARKEGLSAADIFIQNNQFIWVYDITLGKFFKINFNSKNDDLVEREINLTSKLKNLVSPNIINDSLLLATTYSSDDYRYFYANFNEAKKKIGKLPVVINDKLLEDEPDTNFPNRAYMFKAVSIKHPIQNKVAVFYNKADRAEFYEDDTLSKVVIHKNSFNPKMYVTKLERGFSVEDYEKTVYAYLSLAYTEDHIYCLFSGNKNGETSSDKILVFNWNGKFVKELTLDRKINKICIDPKANILYCYDDKYKGIFSTELKF